MRTLHFVYYVYFELFLILFFFFQAEDGIRDLTVTGVQTCALPISRRQLRLELEDLQHRSTRHANPADLAGDLFAGDAKEAAYAFRRRIRHADERAPEDLPIEPYRPAEIGHGDAGVAE